MLLAHGGDDQIVLYVDSAPGRSAVVKVFRCRPQTEVRLGFGGRRRKTSKGRNRDEGTCVGAARAMGI